MSGRKVTDMGGMPHTSDGYIASKAHTRTYSSADGAAHLGSEYPDTTEDIKRDQQGAASKTKAQKMKPGYRY